MDTSVSTEERLRRRSSLAPAPVKQAEKEATASEESAVEEETERPMAQPVRTNHDDWYDAQDDE